MLAGIEDYIARHGATQDPDRVTVLLGDAASFVRHEARLHISQVVDDTAKVRPARGLVILPEFPVTAVGPITSPGPVTVDPTSYAWDESGIVTGLGVGYWLQPITVTYTHGWDPVPEWIVSLVCSIVNRCLRPGAPQPWVQGVTTGSQNVQYASSLAGVNLWMTTAETARLRSLRGPTVR